MSVFLTNSPRMPGMPVRRALMFLGLILPAILCGQSGAWAQLEGDSEVPAGMPVVRADMRAGAFLDPVPFDRPFVVVGRLPGAIQAVAVDVQAYSSVVPLRCSPTRLLAFEGELRSLLDSTLVAGMGVADLAQADWLRRRIGSVLLRVCGRGAHRSMRLSGLLKPWKWVTGGTNGVQQLVGPGTVYDPEGLRDSERGRFLALVNQVVGADSRLSREQALDAIVQEMTGSVRGVQVGITAGNGIPTMRWSRLSGSPNSPQADESSEDGPISVRWNRLSTAASGRSGADCQITEFRLLVPPLEANRTYGFVFRFERDPEDAEVAAFRSEVSRQLGSAASGGAETGAASTNRLRQDLVCAAEGLTGAIRLESPAGGQTLSASIERSTSQRVRVAGPSVDSDTPAVRLQDATEELTAAFRRSTLVGRSTVMAMTEAGNYVSADIGVMHAHEITETGVYVGLNLYLRPVDKSVPLSQKGGLLRRFALTLGIALQSIRDDHRTRDDLFGRQSVMVGAGFRITSSIRIGGGALLLREREPETFPLTERMRLAATPYLSVSFDADVGSRFRGAGRAVRLARRRPR